MANFTLSDKVTGFKLAKNAVQKSQYHTQNGHVFIDLATCNQAQADAAYAAGCKYLIKETKKTAKAETEQAEVSE